MVKKCFGRHNQHQADSSRRMKPKLVRLVSTLLKWRMFQRIGMFRHHWAAYVGHLEGKDDIESRFYYLGIGFALSTLGLLASATDLVGLFKPNHWVENPWYRRAMFTNYYPKEIRKTQTLVWFCYFLEAVLGLCYELFRRQRAPTFMRIYTARGLQELGEEDYRSRFNRFKEYCMAIIYTSTFIFCWMIMLTFTIYGYIQSYSVDPKYLFWVVYVVLQTSSGIYIFVTVPFLLIMSMYYLNLLQQWQLDNIGLIMKKFTKRPTALAKRYEKIVARYVSTNRLLGEFNQFWSFYLYQWIQLYPILITYIIYMMLNYNIRSLVWTIIYAVTMMALLRNLLAVVYVATKVCKKNQLISKSLTNIFDAHLQASLTGDLRRHIHLEAAVENVRLSEYSLRSISNQIVNRKTYFVLIFKFAFIYMKLTKLAKESKS